MKKILRAAVVLGLFLFAVTGVVKAEGGAALGIGDGLFEGFDYGGGSLSRVDWVMRTVPLQTRDLLMGITGAMKPLERIDFERLRAYGRAQTDV